MQKNVLIYYGDIDNQWIVVNALWFRVALMECSSTFQGYQSWTEFVFDGNMVVTC